ncbi:hypothetical protein CQW23_21297 [Capsicum baccatum]|uniref:Uncharacterized protein n=1 Tax=Capsicum baccatum TaxID=33114 RepID=A0A2G2VXL5_CAPBA|nr:hypothetical protein CQW23_21297 [Capsicum baccatum]
MAKDQVQLNPINSGHNDKGRIFFGDPDGGIIWRIRQEFLGGDNVIKNSFSAVVNNNNAVGEYGEREKRISNVNPYYKNSEFLLEKDRLPSEINRKLKPNVGAKKDRDVSNHGLAFDDNYRKQLYRSLLGKLFRLSYAQDPFITAGKRGKKVIIIFKVDPQNHTLRLLRTNVGNKGRYVGRTFVENEGRDVGGTYFGNEGRDSGGDYVIKNRSVVRVKYSQQRPFHSRPYQPPSLSAVVNNNNVVGEYVEREKRLLKANPYYKNSEFLLEKDRLPSEIN